jgi:hypothetical protein
MFWSAAQVLVHVYATRHGTQQNNPVYGHLDFIIMVDLVHFARFYLFHLMS